MYKTKAEGHLEEQDAKFVLESAKRYIKRRWSILVQLEYNIS